MRVKKPANELKFVKVFFESNDDSTEITFPSICKFVREKFKITQVEMANKLNVPFHTYKAWEQGKRDPSSKGSFNLCLMYLQAVQLEQAESQLNQDAAKFLEQLINFKELKTNSINTASSSTV